ncbi:MAG: ankyrin repeat protein [Akkermansiaceae bacterium]|nr:ankyrin repeat protein [Akkermansiaceae bacterium]
MEWLEAVRHFARSRFDDLEQRRRAILELPPAPEPVNGRNRKKQTHPAFRAAADEGTSLMNFIALCGPRPAQLGSQEGKNLAFPAARAGNLEKLEWLVRQGVDPDARDSNGYTPLIYATTWSRDKHVAVVDFLIALGADVKARTSYGESPLANSLSTGRYDIAQRLIDAGADPGSFSFSMLHQAAAWGSGGERASRIETARSLEITDSFGLTPWLVAVHAGNLEAAHHFKAAGASTRAITRQGETPLHLAAAANRIGMLKELLAKEVDLEVVDQGMGWTPLHAAVVHDSPEAVALLLEAGAKAVLGPLADQPINSARSIRVLELLASHGADLNQQDGSGFWPLRDFADDWNLEAVHWLLSQGARVDEHAGDGTVLHRVIYQGKLTIAAVLLEFGADVNATDFDGGTVFSYSRTPESNALLNFYREAGAGGGERA